VESKNNYAIVSVREWYRIITVFSKFAAKPYQGIGLGLIISTSTIEAHDVRIWADNDACGK
jgi:signal transduction histidine kinase